MKKWVYILVLVVGVAAGADAERLVAHNGKQGRLELAEQALSQKKELNVKTAEARKVKAAKQSEAALSEKEQELFTYYFYEAEKCFELEQYDKCLALTEYCLSINPNDAECHQMAGLIYAAMQADIYAELHLQKAVSLAPLEWRYRRTYASRYFNNNHLPKAIEIVEEGVRQAPDNSEIWRSLASLYSSNGNYKAAIKALNQVERIDGINKDITIQKYTLYSTKLVDKKKALREIERYTKAFPTDYQMECFRGQVLLNDRKLDEAYKIFAKALEEHPDDAYVYSSMGSYYMQTLKTQEASELILGALQSNNLDIRSKLSLLNDYESTLESFGVDMDSLLSNMIEHDPLDEGIYRYYVKYLEAAGDTATMLKELWTITDINPGSSDVWDKMINIAIAQQDDSLFAVITNRAIEALPEEAQWYYYKSMLLVRDSLFDDAKQCCKRGIELTTDKELGIKRALYRQLGDICSLQKNWDETFEAYELALKMFPRDTYILNNYAYLLAVNGGDLKKAERMSAITIEVEPTNATFLDTYAWILYLQESRTLAKFYIERAKEYANPDIDMTEIDEHYNIIMRDEK